METKVKQEQEIVLTLIDTHITISPLTYPSIYTFRTDITCLQYIIFVAVTRLK